MLANVRYIMPVESTYPLNHRNKIMTKSTRNTGKHWTPTDVRQLRQYANENTPTRVIGLKLGRTEEAIRSKTSENNISLKPTNQSPYNRRK